MYKKIRDAYVVVRSQQQEIVDVETPWVPKIATNTTAHPGSLPQQHKSKDPQVWGPALWLALHTCAAYYPEKAHALCQMQAKGFIMGLPSMLPCESCSAHAQAFIDAHHQSPHQMDHIVSGRKPLFAFFVDFHNAVNRRQNKKVVSYEEALAMYGNK